MVRGQFLRIVNNSIIINSKQYQLSIHIPSSDPENVGIYSRLNENRARLLPVPLTGTRFGFIGADAVVHFGRCFALVGGIDQLSRAEYLRG